MQSENILGCRYRDTQNSKVRIIRALGEHFGTYDFTVGDVMSLSEAQIIKLKNIGRKSIQDLREFMEANKLQFCNHQQSSSINKLQERQKELIARYDEEIAKSERLSDVNELLKMREECIRNFLELNKLGL